MIGPKVRLQGKIQVDINMLVLRHVSDNIHRGINTVYSRPYTRWIEETFLIIHTVYLVPYLPEVWWFSSARHCVVFLICLLKWNQISHTNNVAICATWNMCQVSLFRFFGNHRTGHLDTSACLSGLMIGKAIITVQNHAGEDQNRNLRT